MSECDSLLFHFVGNNRLVHVHLPGDRIHLNYDGTEIVFESIAFCLKKHLWKSTESSDQTNVLGKVMERDIVICFKKW